MGSWGMKSEDKLGVLNGVLNFKGFNKSESIVLLPAQGT
jgi:hypothetical protein